MPPAPSSGFKDMNRDGEPGLATAPDGSVWVAATIDEDPRRYPVGFGVVPSRFNPSNIDSGADVWVSHDGGRSFAWVASPMNLLAREPGFGGGDADITVAQRRNGAGFYNVYAVIEYGEGHSPAVSEISLAISRDGGRRWLLDPTAGIPGGVEMDRPWVAAEGACVVDLAFHVPALIATVVDRYDVCSIPGTVTGITDVPLLSSRYLALAPSAATNAKDVYTDDLFGKIIADNAASSPFRGRLYVPVISCPAMSLTDRLGYGASGGACPNGNATPHMLIGTEHGRQWKLVKADDGTSPTPPGTWWLSASTDARGVLYFAWSENHHVYLNVSHDGGQTWSRHRQVDATPSTTSIEPSVAADGTGDLVVAWYGTTRPGDPASTRDMGLPLSTSGAPWYMYAARSVDGGASFTQATASGLVHLGAVGCSATVTDVVDLLTAGATYAGCRDLWDDFGVGITRDTATIAFSTDQPGNDFAHDHIAYATAAR
jgi:hypothetical protein